MPRTSTDAQSRRQFVQAAGAIAAAGLIAKPAWAHAEKNLVSMWKNADCGCCNAWIKHLQANGFKVVAADVADTAEFRKQFDMPDKYASCHTATVEGYAIEGHVPARDIRRLLRERPKAVGLAVPGMPVGSPGMEMGSRKAAYDVLLVSLNGGSRVYQSYPSSL